MRDLNNLAGFSLMELMNKLLTTLSIFLIATSSYAQTYTVERVIDGDDQSIIDRLMNAKYFIDAHSTEVQLKDGSYKNDPGQWKGYFAVNIDKDLIRLGDLDNNGQKEAVAILTWNGGGTGHFRELIVLKLDEDQPEQTTSKSLGDRVIINSMRIELGEIVLDMVTHGPNDPMCCPNLKVIKRYKLIEDQLTVIGMNPNSEAVPEGGTYTVERVIDGDTIQLTNGEEVQLIGIKAPEDEKMGQEATEFVNDLTEFCQENKVILEFDVQDRDKYGRLLAYVFCDKQYGGLGLTVFTIKYSLGRRAIDGLHYGSIEDISRIFLNASIIKSGYATPMTIPPNVKHADLFKELYEEARAQKRGLWESINPYLVDFRYCEQNEDCAMRASVCGDEPMNIHFDNTYFTKFIVINPDVECFGIIPLKNPKCVEGKCFSDEIDEEAKEAMENKRGLWR